MFLIPTFLGPSSIHGTGVFTAQAIPAGTLIWRLDKGVDWVFSPEEFSELPEPFYSRMWPYLYTDAQGLLVLCGDNGRFMNHSDTPNCQDNDIYTWARRDIVAGEELTCDYREFDKLSAEKGEPVF